MPLHEFLMPELDLEMEATRKHLERVPIERFDFKPHEKSMTLGWLATFNAMLPSWGALALTGDSFDVKPAGGPTIERSNAGSIRELLDMFDKNVRDVRSALVRTDDQAMRKPWSLLAAGHLVFRQPRFLIFRTYFLNHAVHHRAQLGVYLRLTGVPVPAVYNDSADERGGMFIDSPAGVSTRA
jgi:DinB family protein